MKNKIINYVVVIGVIGCFAADLQAQVVLPNPQYRQPVIQPPPNIQFSAPYMLSNSGSGGAYPSIRVDANGNRRFFYSVTSPAPEHLALRMQAFGAPLGSETILSDASGNTNWGTLARPVATHYSGPANLDSLAMGKSNSAYVLKTTDNGVTYAYDKNYANGTSGCSSYLPVYLQRDLSDSADPKRLVFGYLYNNGVFGCTDNYVYQAQQTCSGSCSWPLTATQVMIGAAPVNGRVVGVFESGPLLNLMTSAGVVRSVNNGATFTLLNNANTVQENLKANDAEIGGNNILYLVRAFTYGTNGVNQHLVFHSSLDFGATWSAARPIIVNAAVPFVDAKIAISQHAPATARLLAVWKTATAGLYQQLRAAVSYNGGTSWQPAQTVVLLNGTEQISDIDVDYDSTSQSFLIAYGVINGTSRLGVYSVEGQ